jgi:aquaporin Z
MSEGPGWVRRALFALEPPVGAEFDDPRLEWRRLFSEFLGTFLLVMVAAGAPVVNAAAAGSVSPAAQAVAPGLMVMAVIYFLGAVGGAHLNPAVTVSFALRRNFPWLRVPGYVVMQLLGVTAAVLFLRVIFGNIANLGATTPRHGFSNETTLVLEAVLTLGLVSVILGTASGARNIGTNAALAIGGYIALAGLWAAPITGASMNPARSFGPALVGDHWSGFWAYVVGPFVGGAIAVAFAWILRGPPSQAGSEAAQGSMRQTSDGRLDNHDQPPEDPTDT